MTLEDFGNLGDFIGGLAVIATLVYLAVQIRQNTRMLRAAGEQTTRSDSTATITLAAQTPENAAVFHKGLSDPAVLSPEERTQFNLFMAAAFYHFQQGYTAFQGGTQSQDTWKSQLLALRLYSARPRVRDWWRRQGNGLFDSESECWRLADSEIRKHDEPTA